jgi:hypothetical protein
MNEIIFVTLLTKILNITTGTVLLERINDMLVGTMTWHVVFVINAWPSRL